MQRRQFLAIGTSTVALGSVATLQKVMANAPIKQEPMEEKLPNRLYQFEAESDFGFYLYRPGDMFRSVDDTIMLRSRHRSCYERQVSEFCGSRCSEKKPMQIFAVIIRKGNRLVLAALPKDSNLILCHKNEYEGLRKMKPTSSQNFRHTYVLKDLCKGCCGG